MAKEVIIQDIIIPGSSPPCDTWKAYYKKLNGKFGKVNARMIWLKTWEINGSSSCTTNADFNKWLKQNDIDVSSAATRAVADISQIGGNILGFGKTMTKVLMIGVPVTLGVVVLLILFFMVKTAREAKPSDLAMLHPAGRAAKMGGAI